MSPGTDLQVQHGVCTQGHPPTQSVSGSKHSQTCYVFRDVILTLSALKLFAFILTLATPTVVHRYRKTVSNVCDGGLDKEQTTKQHNCPLLAPEGLQVSIKGQMLAVAPGDDITFMVHQERVGKDLFFLCFWHSLQRVSLRLRLRFLRVTPPAPSTRWTLGTVFGPFTRT